MTDSATVGDARARLFGVVAEAYDRYRPGPPPEAIDWVLPAKASRVLDLGAGTGAVARSLVDRFALALAVEPDARMLAVLTSRTPGVVALAGVAEAIPLADGSLDAVVISATWHWLDPTQSTSELARVLRPGGTLGLLGNGMDPRQRWAQDLLEGRRTPADAGPRPEPQSERYSDDLLPEGAPFAAPELRRMPWSCPVTVEEVVGLAGTYSDMRSLSPEDQDLRLRRVARLAEARLEVARPGGGRNLGPGRFELPMVCRCWRARRL